MKKNLNIQGLRAIFAMMVFWGHAFGALKTSWYEPLYHTPVHLFWDGAISVVCFFVLSGWFYYNVGGGNITSYVRLLMKRTYKIVLPYWIALLFGALLWGMYDHFGVEHYDSATDWFSGFWNGNVTFGKIFHDALIFSRGYKSPDYIIPSSWYLETDLKMMFFIPVFVYLFRRFGWYWVILPIIPAILNISIFPIAFPFLVGAIYHHNKNVIDIFLRNRLWLKIMIFVASVVCLDVKNLRVVDFSKESSYYFLLSQIQAVGAGMLICLVASMNESKALANKIMVFIGEISYEFYIVHMVVLLALEPFFVNPYPFIIVSLFLSLFLSVLLRRIVALMTRSADKMVKSLF